MQMIQRAEAILSGGNGMPEIHGTAQFQQRSDGVLVTVNVFGLPKGDGECNHPIFAMHIHDGGACSGNAEDEFADAGMHYNPKNCPHPQHAGDLPPLFGCNGIAYCSVLTNRFTVSEIIGKTLILHDRPDDFKTQPSGDAGTKIACGVIQIR